jgi:putative transposase
VAEDADFDHPAVTLAHSNFSGFLNAPLTKTRFAPTLMHALHDRWGGRHAYGPLYRLEYLADDLAPLATHLGFLLFCRLPASQRPAIGVAFIPVRRQVVADMCRYRETHGYSFDPV